MSPARWKRTTPTTTRCGRRSRWCRRAFAITCAARHPAIRYALTLNDRGYFWEAQEVLEAVWAAAPQGGRERILLRACIQVANGNLRLRMQKPHAASRLWGEALSELHTLSARKAVGAGDGFADGFPTAELAVLLKAKTGKPELTKADWVAFSTIGRT